MENNEEHLKETVERGVFIPWEEVKAEILAFTDLGIKVSINNTYKGLVYGNQVYDDYEKGQKLKAYIKLVREDGKIDVSFEPNQAMHVILTADKIMEHLKEAGGKSKFNDKSYHEDIQDEFQVSKKVFKQAIGNLYKQKKIIITDEGIELVE